jgi:hypothetical protein
MKKNDSIENALRVKLNEHQFKANIFYELQNYYKNLAKSDKNFAILSLD